MKANSILIFFSMFFLGILYTQAKPAPTETKLERQVQKLFSRMIKKHDLSNAFLKIEAPQQGLQKQWQHGADEDGTPYQGSQPFYTASVTKAYTAVLVMQLVEQGRLSLDDSIGEYLPAEQLLGLHKLNGKDYSTGISIRQLLSHRSGLPDHFEDAPLQGENMMAQLLAEPNRNWTPAQILEFCRGRFAAHFIPGKGYHYSDLGYVLLGLLVERLSGQPYEEYLIQAILKPLGMEQSRMIQGDKTSSPSQDKMARLFAGEQEIGSYASLSADWAGGGLISNSAELSSFMQALLEHKLLKPESVQAMQQWTRAGKGMYYGFGLWKWEMKEVFSLLPNLSLIGHSGTTGAFMYYCPQLDCYLSGSFNQTETQEAHVKFLFEVAIKLWAEQKNRSHDR